MIKAPTMVETLLKDTLKWAKAGFTLAGGDVITHRLEQCKSCEFWDKKSYGGSGKCTVCGCSTKAKLVLSTSKCPKDKW